MQTSVEPQSAAGLVTTTSGPPIPDGHSLKCASCNGAITSQYVRPLGAIYHATCFRCMVRCPVATGALQRCCSTLVLIWVGIHRIATRLSLQSSSHSPYRIQSRFRCARSVGLCRPSDLQVELSPALVLMPPVSQRWTTSEG